MIRTFATLLFATSLVLKARATAQAAERLLYKGETNRLCTLPLDAYLKQHSLRLYEIAPPRGLLQARPAGAVTSEPGRSRTASSGC